MEFNDSNPTNLSYANNQQEFILAASKRSVHNNWTRYGILYLPCYHPYRVNKKCVNGTCSGAKSRFWALLSDLHGIVGHFR